MSSTGGIQSLVPASAPESPAISSDSPLLLAYYVRTTRDAAILDELIPFLEGKPLEPQQTESLSIPAASKTEHTLLEHCRCAIQRSATVGPHGLPLIGSGD